jgi:hypothetical protein
VKKPVKKLKVSLRKENAAETRSIVRAIGIRSSQGMPAIVAEAACAMHA